MPMEIPFETGLKVLVGYRVRVRAAKPGDDS